MRIPVEGHPNLYRDSKTNAIINTDKTAYNNYLKSLSSKEKEKKEIEDMKNELDEIKTLLYQLLEKNGSK
jgi:hypothetical protein